MVFGTKNIVSMPSTHSGLLTYTISHSYWVWTCKNFLKRTFSLCRGVCKPPHRARLRLSSVVQSIPEKYYIRVAPIGLNRRGGSNRSPMEVENSHLLLFRTRDEDPDRWMKAAKELQEAFEICNSTKMKI